MNQVFEITIFIVITKTARVFPTWNAHISCMRLYKFVDDFEGT